MALAGLWRRLTQGSEAEIAAGRLLVAVSAIARQPAFFTEGRLPDELEARLELLHLHAALALIRLKAAPEARGLAQAFTDQHFRSIDAGLREAGVGDLTVPKKMQKIAQAFYGRLAVYAEALAAGDRQALAAALARNALPAAAAGFAPALADYAAETHAGLAGQPVEALERLDSWRQAPA
ncbi:MAG: ubiquinol-cytochrome C chaperone family protein [Hyphomonadaceae bacterium]